MTSLFWALRRAPIIAIGFLIVAFAIPSWAGVDGDMDLGVNRYGGDLSSFPAPNADPGVCKQACLNDGRCVAWSFVKPGSQGAQAVCWLKGQTPNPTLNPCCISGTVSRVGGGSTGGQSFGANLAGDWASSGYTYSIAQNGGNFTWWSAALNQKAQGTINGGSLQATWFSPEGAPAGSATGNITQIDANGNARRIEWSNGTVFTR